MLNMIICTDDNIFGHSFYKLISEFFHNEGLKTNLIIINNYEKEFNKTFKLDNTFYILTFENNNYTFDSLTKKINNYNKGIPILVLNNECKKSILNYLNGISTIKNTYNNLNHPKTIKFKDKNTYYSLDKNKILYITTDTNKRQTIIGYDDRIYKVSKSLIEIISMLDDNFIQTHRSCFINKTRLEYMDLTNNIIKFDNNISIEYLSRRFKKNW